MHAAQAVDIYTFACLQGGHNYLPGCLPGLLAGGSRIAHRDGQLHPKGYAPATVNRSLVHGAQNQRDILVREKLPEFFCRETSQKESPGRFIVAAQAGSVRWAVPVALGCPVWTTPCD